MVATKNQLEFEDLLEEIGEFGSFQKKMLVNFLAPVSIALPVLVMNILFLVNTPGHHCYIPEVVSNNLTFDVQKSLFSHDKATCYMYDLNYTEWLKTNSSHVPTNTSLLPCNKGWEYDTAHFEETATSKNKSYTSAKLLETLLSMYLVGVEKVPSSGIRIEMLADNIVLQNSGADYELKLKLNDSLTALVNFPALLKTLF
ncbi:carcinine transporter [Trichonephila inaurata madagascariensis]|uniref:Carcinine transporter n=1 Tax=Trichonephila inaurata madagascariensis TaxID=2747483 RepID=A0A8X6JUL9_9ARAC|nr:carcinine transporter [Trichonephila inaurata madagascariensis]